MNISNYLHKFTKRSGGGSHVPVTLYWQILLAVAAVVLVCVIAWSLWTFQTVLKPELTGVADGTFTGATTAVFDKQGFEKARALINDRATENEKYVLGTYRFADPSQ